MGHWQQIAEENRKVRAVRARWPWWRRQGLAVLTVALILAAWLVVLAPVWRWLL
jgi:hypothetical protein